MRGRQQRINCLSRARQGNKPLHRYRSQTRHIGGSTKHTRDQRRPVASGSHKGIPPLGGGTNRSRKKGLNWPLLWQGPECMKPHKGSQPLGGRQIPLPGEGPKLAPLMARSGVHGAPHWYAPHRGLSLTSRLREVSIKFPYR